MIDTLGYPITQGTLVLTSGYYSTDRSVVTKVIRANKRTVTVVVPELIWDSKARKYTTSFRKVRRRYDQVLAIEQQLEYNKKHFPEYSI